jgi:hypothetical protein
MTCPCSDASTTAAVAPAMAPQPRVFHRCYRRAARSGPAK